MKLLKITPERNIEFPNICFQAVTQIVKLENISDKKVAFKIKTTAPNNYLVRPSFGIINVNKTMDIQIVLQPLTGKDNISSDKFQVQCLNVNDDVVVNKQFWSQVNKNALQDYKLVVVLSDENSGKNVNSHLQNNTMSISEINKSSQLPNYADNNSVITEESNTEGMKGLPGMQRKYHELLNYCVFVDKQKLALEKENESLKNQLKALSNSSNRFFMEKIHIPIIIIVLAIIAKYMGYW